MKTPWVFLIAFALVCYGTGASLMESFVGYSSWHLVGSAEFTTIDNVDTSGTSSSFAKVTLTRKT